MCKLKYLLPVFLLIFFVASSHAETPPPGGWKWDNAKVTVTREHNAFKASLQAQKTYQVAVVDPKTREILMKTKQQASTVKVAPTAARVGKTLMKRVPAAAMTQAIIALLGKSVDWLLDPENNGVKYKEPKIDDMIVYYTTNQSARASTADASCQLYAKSFYEGASRPATAVFKPNAYDDIAGFCHIDNNYTGFSNVFPVRVVKTDIPAPEPEWKRIPINSVAQKVIEQANAGEAPATQVISDTALDMFEAGELDAALDAAADPKVFNENEYHPNDPALKDFGTGTDGQPGQNGSDGQPGQDGQPAELPAFCSWASIVCDWIGWTKEAHQETQDAIAENTEAQNQTNEKLDSVTVTREDGQQAIAVEPPAFCDWASYVCDFIDWVQTEPEDPDDDGNIDVQVPDQDMHVPILERLYISMPAQCPADPVLEFMGGKIPFPMSVFCQFATMMKPLILLLAYIKGLSIIGNGLT